jgi:hypothetical protein
MCVVQIKNQQGANGRHINQMVKFETRMLQNTPKMLFDWWRFIALKSKTAEKTNEHLMR